VDTSQLSEQQIATGGNASRSKEPFEAGHDRSPSLSVPVQRQNPNIAVSHRISVVLQVNRTALGTIGKENGERKRDGKENGKENVTGKKT